MRRFFFAIVLLLGILFVIVRIAELETIIETMQKGDWRFILLAFSIQAIWLLIIALSYQTIFKTIGIQEKLENLVLIVASANFVNTVAPSAGISGMAVFASEAQRRNYSPARAAVAGALFLFLDYLGFLMVLGLGLLVLFRRNNLTVAELVASGILVCIALALAALLYLGMHSARSLGKALAWTARQINYFAKPIIHRDYLSEKRAYAFASDATQGLLEFKRKPHRLVLPVLLALSSKGLLIAIFLFVFLAFDVPISPGTIIAGFSIGFLFLIVSPTPAGIGVVEGVLTLVLSSMYIPLGVAAVITMTYRGITFWLPLLFGMVAFRWLGNSKGTETATP